MNQPPAQTVDANHLVCLRCKAVTSATNAPDTTRRYSRWSWKRGRTSETVTTHSSKLVCSYCGSSEMVPAGTPRGVSILAEQGITVTGKLCSGSSFGCAGCFFGVIAILALVALGNVIWPTKEEEPSTSEDSPAPKPHSPAVAKQPLLAETPLETPRPVNHEPPPSVPDDPKSKADRAVFDFHHGRALAGEPGSMLRLAELYLAGTGCEVNTNAAKTWLQKAAEQGYPGAKEELLKLP